MQHSGHVALRIFRTRYADRLFVARAFLSRDWDVQVPDSMIIQQIGEKKLKTCIVAGILDDYLPEVCLPFVHSFLWPVY